VDNLYYHQYRYDKVTDDTTKLGSGGTDIESKGTTSKSMKFPLLYNHKREDLVGQLFSRDKECIYVGVEDVQEGGEINSALTFDDVMREGKHKVREGKSSGQVANDRDSPTLDETYLQYYLSKGRLTMERADAMRESNSHELIRAMGVNMRLSLIQILRNTQSESYASAAHNHTSITHLLPSQCKLLGRGRWFFCGLVVPSITWRVQSLLLSIEARNVLSQKLSLKQNLSGSLFQKMKESIRKQTSCSGSSFFGVNDVQISNSTTALPSANMMLAALTPRLALEIHDSERLEFLGDTVLKMLISWAVYLYHPLAQEGELTIERTKIISNANLSMQAKRNELVPYLRAVSFSTGKQELLHMPPGMRYVLDDSSSDFSQPHAKRGLHLRTLWNRNINKNVKKSEFEKKIQKQRMLDTVIRNGGPAMIQMSSDDASLSAFCSRSKEKGKKRKATVPPSDEYITADVKAKVLADMMEALLGAFYVSGGLDQAMELLNALQIWPTTPDVSVTQSKSGIDRTSDLSAAILLQIENSFQYSFHNPLLLQEALSCPSASPSSTGEESYQRLEFLGDGVLDLAVVDLLYHAHPTSSQGHLTDVKCSLISNKALGLIGFGLELHKCVLTSSPHLAFCLEHLTAAQCGNSSDCVEDEMIDDKGDGSVSTDTASSTGIKVLADVLEAIIGAIFIDSQYSLSTIQRVARHVNIVPEDLLFRGC